MSKKFKLSVGLIMLLVFSLAIAGCGDKTVATVNGEKITQKQLDEELDFKSKQIGINLKDPKFESMVDALKQQTLEEIIQKVIILQEAKDRKIEITDKEVEESIDNIAKEFFEGDRKALDEYLTGQGLSLSYIENEIKVDLAESKIVEQVLADAKINDKAVNKYYEDNLDSFGKQIEASHILVETEEEAKGIIEQLKKVEDKAKFGEEFAKLAQEKSTDTTNSMNGGKLGYFGEGKMVPEFQEAAFALAVEEFSLEPVKTEFGYHVVYVTGSKETFEDYKEDIKRNLEGEVLNKFFTELQGKAEIDYKIEFKPQAPTGMGGGMPPAGGGMPPASGNVENPHGPNGDIPLDDTGEPADQPAENNSKN